MSRALPWVWCGLGVLSSSFAACGDSALGGAANETTPCGDGDPCDADEFCIATQGAVCQPLPPPGESCAEGCVLTEHCCNCTTHACLRAPSEECPDGPSCECLESGFLMGCEPERRSCEPREGGVHVECIAVAYDEDPFAEGGAGGIGGSDGGAGSGGQGL